MFRAIMLTHSVSGAAKLLNVSQPAVSRLLSYTESRVGLPLFERIKGRLYPTPEARLLFNEVNEVYQRIQRVNEVTRDLVEKRHGTLRVAAIPGLGQTIIPMAIAKFRSQFPDVNIKLNISISTDVVNSLVNRESELGVVTSPAIHPSLVSKPLYENHLMVAMPPSHPLANKRKISPEDLLNEDLVGYGSDTPLGRLIQQVFSSFERAPRVAVEVRFTHMACALVQAGNGMAIVDELAVAGRAWPDVVVRPLDTKIKMHVRILHHLEPLPLLAQDFIKTLETVEYHSLRHL